MILPQLIKGSVSTGACNSMGEVTTEKLRKCNKCGQQLPVENFYVRKDRPNEIIRICKACAAKRQREYSRNNPEKTKEISARCREKHREELKQRNREFYHKHKNDPAYKESLRKTKEKHGEEWKAKDRARRKAFNEKWKRPCEKCGENRLYLIQFHHIDPSTKSFCIGANVSSKKENILEKEVKKCVCLCSNCHDEFHYFYGNVPDNPIHDLEEYLGKPLQDRSL